ncbi:MAG: PhoU domain-containing protein [Calditrichaceae bacterium]|jgi:phosphate transport system protein
MWQELVKIWKADNLLKQAWNTSYEMIEITHEMFLESMKALRQQEHDKVNKEIRAKDKKINKYEREVRRDVLTHLAVQGAKDVPAGLVLITIIIDIERIGDYTKNIVELVDARAETLSAGEYEENLTKVEDSIKHVFQQTIICLRESKQEEAVQLLFDYKWVNIECDRNLMEIIKNKETGLDSGNAAALAIYFRYLKRIHSHLRNILTSVVNPFDRIGYKVKKKQLKS